MLSDPKQLKNQLLWTKKTYCFSLDSIQKWETNNLKTAIEALYSIKLNKQFTMLCTTEAFTHSKIFLYKKLDKT